MVVLLYGAKTSYSSIFSYAYERNAHEGRQPRNGFIVDSLETTKQMEKIYFQHTVFFGALGL